MRIDELRQLMAAIAATDRRTTSKEDVDFWAAMAAEGRWTLGAAMRALVQFRTTRPGEWLEAGHLSAIIREARHKAAASFVAPDVPDEITGRQYPAWYRQQISAHVEGVLEDWARGEQIPESLAELEARRGRRALPDGIESKTCPEHLRGQLEIDMAQFGRIDRLPSRAGEQEPAAEDPQRAAARAEIEALRARSEGQDGAA